MIRKRRIIYTALFSLLLACIAVLITVLSPYWIREKLNPNSISVSIDKPIKLTEVTISWGYNLDNDIILFKNGKDLNKRYKKYGENNFYVMYQDSLIAKFHQFKLNNWHGHNYEFHLSIRNDSIITEWNVEGPDSHRILKIYPTKK